VIILGEEQWVKTRKVLTNNMAEKKKPTKMKKVKNNVFWQALLLTIVVFIIGLYLGMVMEENRLQKINNYYIDSEVSMMDILALNNLIDNSNISCDELKNANFDLLDRVYEEAILLEDYEASGKITDNLDNFHKKYDVLRTYLWIDSMKIRNKCNNFNTVAYVYVSETDDLTKKATQNVWSRVLYDLKQEQGRNVLLVPMAVDQRLISLESILKNYNISEYPVVIINEEIVLNELSSVEEINQHLN